MANYKEKNCKICGSIFKPSNPNQKYCSEKCKIEGSKELARIRDRKRNRVKYGYKEYRRKCEACGKEFVTYYSKKRYCGSEECEKERIRRKNKILHQCRDKYLENIRKTWYYRQTKDKRLLQKAIKYRELHNTDKEYTPRGFQKYTISFVRKYVEQFGYKLLSQEYKNNKEEILLLCPEGHEWKTTFHGFKDANARCFHCYLMNNYTSAPEQKFVDYFIENYPNLKFIHRDRRQIAPKEIDLYFPEHKIGVEVCGLYWHSEIAGGKDKKYHYEKMMLCKDKGIRLFTIFEDEVNFKFDIVISRILVALNLIKNRIYARKCVIKELDTRTVNDFYRINHIQGATQPSKSWGLFYNDELVQACSIGKFIRKHTSGNNLIELKRFCTKNYHVVIGGVSKLFKVIINYCEENNIAGIKSYCDMRYANIFNPIYEKLGFKLVNYTKYTPHYIKGCNRFRNFSLRKTKEEQKLGYTEFELRLRQGYDRIWDCGHRTYLYMIED